MNGVSSETANAEERLAVLLEESSHSWSAAGSGWLADQGTMLIRAEASGEEAVFSSDLIEWTDRAASSRGALAMFLDELNRRWHPVRALMSHDKVVVRVVLPAATWGSEEIDRAVDALLFAHKRAKKECAALLHKQVAQLYLQFHQGENNNNGNHDD
jgi:hypothetical protein